GAARYPGNPPPFYLADGSADVIVHEFSIPPSHPMVIKITRQVTFARGEPVVASNLLAALNKKYGEAAFSASAGLNWVFDAAGKPVTRLPPALRSCAPSN